MALISYKLGHNKSKKFEGNVKNFENI